MKTCKAYIYAMFGCKGAVCITVQYRGKTIFDVTDKEAILAGVTRDALAKAIAKKHGFTHMLQINEATGYNKRIAL